MEEEGEEGEEEEEKKDADEEAERDKEGSAKEVEASDLGLTPPAGEVTSSDQKAVFNTVCLFPGTAIHPWL